MENNIDPNKEITIIKDEKIHVINTEGSTIGTEFSFTSEINWYQSATMAKDIY